MSLKGNLLAIPMQACFYHKNAKIYKLLNMTTLKKTLCQVRIFSFYNTACNPICMLSKTYMSILFISKTEKGY